MLKMTASPHTCLTWPMIALVGPDPADVGGIATVIRTYMRLLPAVTAVELVPSWRPDASAAGLFPALAAARRLTGLRPQHRREGVLVHVHLSHRGSFWREGTLARLATALGYPVFLTVHGSDFVATSNTRRWRRIYRTVLGRADGVAVLNDEALNAVRRLAPRAAVTLVPNPGPVSLQWTPTTSAGGADPVVLFAGEVSRRTGVDVLLRAWPSVARAVPGARLLIAGPAGGVDVNAVPGVRALGPVSPDRIRGLLGDARVAVLPSRAEGMPMFVLEAMAAGRPVVGTTVGAMPEMLAGAGLVVEPEDAGQLAAALTGYLCDPGRADHDGTAGRERYLLLHSPATTLRLLAHFYGIDTSGR
jgi:glycosyltransferase involved in cell wall biosynthesis